MYRHLRPEKIIETISILNDHIFERFPNADLNNVCTALIEIAKNSKEKIAEFSKPILFMRVIIGLVILISIIIIYSPNYITLT
jgi:hypothetical protein